MEGSPFLIFYVFIIKNKLYDKISILLNLIKQLYIQPIFWLDVNSLRKLHSLPTDLCLLVTIISNRLRYRKENIYIGTQTAAIELHHEHE